MISPYLLARTILAALVIPLTATTIPAYGENLPKDRHYHVQSFYGEEMKDELWQRPQALQRYHIGVLFPTLNDSYWIAANYGIVTHAQRLGVAITLLDADGYTNFGDQRQQMEWLAANPDIHGILLATVDYSKMDPFVEQIIEKPVIGLINDIHTNHVKAKSTYSFYAMGHRAAEYMFEDAAGRDIKVLILPGPEKSGWAEQYFEGIKDAITELKSPGQKVDASKPLYGDTRPKVQAIRIQFALDDPKNKDTNYILGNSVAAVEAVHFLDKHPEKFPHLKIISTYLTIEVYKEITKGRIIAAPIDKTIDQAEIALDLMVKYLNHEPIPDKILPYISIITPGTLNEFNYEELFGTPGFKPVFDKLPKGITP